MDFDHHFFVSFQICMCPAIGMIITFRQVLTQSLKLEGNDDLGLKQSHTSVQFASLLLPVDVVRSLSNLGQHIQDAN